MWKQPAHLLSVTHLQNGDKIKVGGSGATGAEISGKFLWQPNGCNHYGPLAR